MGRDPRLAVPLIAALRAERDLVVGDNEPYAGALANDTMYRHATRRGLAHALIEIRQDLIGDAAGAAAWAARLARIVADLNRLAGVHEIRHYGSHAGGLARRRRRRPGRSRPDDRRSDADRATELEAAAFRRLVAHLGTRTDVQNIDLMNLAGFCRNCLANWYRDAADEAGVEIEQGWRARDSSTACPMREWQARTRRRRSGADLAAFEKNRPKSRGGSGAPEDDGEPSLFDADAPTAPR